MKERKSLRGSGCMIMVQWRKSEILPHSSTSSVSTEEECNYCRPHCGPVSSGILSLSHTQNNWYRGIRNAGVQKQWQLKHLLLFLPQSVNLSSKSFSPSTSLLLTGHVVDVVWDSASPNRFFCYFSWMFAFNWYCRTAERWKKMRSDKLNSLIFWI